MYADGVGRKCYHAYHHALHSEKRRLLRFLVDEVGGRWEVVEVAAVLPLVVDACHESPFCVKWTVRGRRGGGEGEGREGGMGWDDECQDYMMLPWGSLRWLVLIWSRVLILDLFKKTFSFLFDL